MNLQVIKNRVLYWLKTIVLYGLYIFIIFLITSFFVLQIPVVQSALANRFLRSFSEVTDFQSSIEKVEFYWFDRVVLTGVVIKDPEQNIMIGVDRVIVNFKFSEMLQDKNINLDGALIDGAQVNIKTIQDSDSVRDLNINVFTSRLNQPSSSSRGGSKVTIGEAILRNSRFTYNTDLDSLEKHFDPNHFAVNISNAELNNFLILGDTVQFNVGSFSATEEKLDFTIHELTTFFLISQQRMEFSGVKVRAGKSIISDSIVFSFNGQPNLSRFVDSVMITANLTNTVIHPSDLSLFVPLPAGIIQPVSLNSKFTGRLSKFRATQMDLKIGDTHLQGSLEMEGLPDISETFILLSLKRSQINFTDLAFLFNENSTQRLKPLGTLNFQGQFLGYPTDFVAAGDFSGQLGRIVSDINLKINEASLDLSEYAGKLLLSNFDLGKYLNDTINFQKVSVSGNIEGRGLSLESADFTLNGTVNSIGLKGYNYQNITTNARFSSKFFNGSITIKDPNLEFEADGSVDLRNDLNRIKIQGSLTSAHLKKLNLSPEEIFFQTQMDIDIKGLVLDSLLGNAQLTNSLLVYEGDSVALTKISLVAKKNEMNRLLRLETSLFDAQAKGAFYFSNLFNDIPVLIKEYQMNIENDHEVTQKYYEQKITTPQKYDTDFEFNIKDIKPITALFGFDFHLSENTLITGRFSSGPTSILHAYSQIDSIVFGANHFYKTEVEINASKEFGSPETLAMMYLQSKTQELSKIKTDYLITEIIWDRNHMDVGLSISQQATTNRFDLSSTVDFKDSTHIKFHPSTIRVLEKSWDVHPDNAILIAGKEWSFRNIGFLQLNQSIKLNGYISSDSSRELTLKILDFDLTNINPLIIRRMEGFLNAEVVLNNFYTTPNIQNTISINNLEVDDFLFGNITGNNAWHPEEKRFSLEFFIDRMESRIVNCIGYYDPFNETSPININAQFNKANLKIFEPFIGEILSQFQGTLSGNYSVTGTLPQPKFSGEGKLENGGLMVNYLKTVYRFTGILGMTPTSIYFKDIDLTDAFRNQGKLNGAITHTNFRGMQIRVDAQFEDFQVLNTTAKDNSLFYGQGYASGDVNFSGPLNNLVITSTATSRKNTRIYIPISGTSSVEKKDYINFVSFTDSTYLASQDVEVSKKINLTGVTVDLNLEVTPDAYCEIIFDLKAGDIIRGRGNGKIKLQLDTKGEFNMFGPIEFTEGWYNFTLYDIINKEFQIKPGSNITWFGDPYQGTMKIDASYNQLASLSPILTDPSLSNVPQLKRKYPVQVLLKLDGPMLSPIINFDIVAEDLPKSVPVEGRPPVSLDIEFIAFKNKLDEQELKRQVFSLIILRRFSPPESFNTSGSLVNSVSELFSNQLSYWLSQVDENLEIDVDLGSMDEETFNAFQLRMSYTFMSGRLRVTRDGTIGNQAPAGTTTTSTNNELASAIGDWTVDYLLSPDGKFKVKMYSRTNINSLTSSINSQNVFTTGVSLMHTQNFNEFKNLLRSSRDKNRRTVLEDEEQNDEAFKEEDNDGG